MYDPATSSGKRCMACGVVKPLDQFWRRKDRPDGPGGRAPRCRDCSSRTERRVRPADPEAAEKQCTGCGLVKPIAEFWRRARSFDGLSSRCKDCRSPGYTARRDAPPKTQEELQAENRAKAIRYGQKLRQTVFAHYGEACACCGSTEEPTIDHPGGDGAAHRTAVIGRPQAAGIPFYRWLIAQGLPEEFVTLCRRCNASKLNGSACRLDHAREVQS